MIITSNNTVFLETQQEVWKINFFDWRINKKISGIGKVLYVQLFLANSVDFYVYELT